MPINQFTVTGYRFNYSATIAANTTHYILLPQPEAARIGQFTLIPGAGGSCTMAASIINATPYLNVPETVPANYWEDTGLGTISARTSGDLPKQGTMLKIVNGTQPTDIILNV